MIDDGKEGGDWQIEKVKIARERTQRLLKNTARVVSLKPQTKTARVRTQGLLKKTARVRTQALLKVEVIGSQDGEFEERERKKSGKREEEKEEEGKGT